MSRKAHLRSEIIDLMLLRESAGRPDLIKETGARAATVFKIIDELKSESFIIEPDRVGIKTGRRAPQLMLNGDYQWTVGLDFQSERIIGTVVNLRGEIIDTVIRDARARGNPAACCEEIRQVIDGLRRNNNEHWDRVKGIGFADPGLVDSVNGISLRAVNIPGWENVPIGKWLTREYRLPAGIWPECLIKTYMEYLTRCPERAPESLFHISLGEGIGGGYIRGGECFTGANNRAMEIGHVIVAPEGPLCQCGNRGCLEALAGINGIRRKISEVISSGVDTELSLNDFSLKKFVECAAAGDKAARIIAGDICHSIGDALAVVVTLLNPEMIVISGETAGLGQLLISEIRRTLSSSCFSGSVDKLKIDFSTLDELAAARGSAIMMRKQLLELENW